MNEVGLSAIKFLAH